jgi:hypothetical protein
LGVRREPNEKGRRTSDHHHDLAAVAEYMEPGPRDAEQTLNRLIAVLDSQDVARAIERLEKGHGLRVVK